ncbi:SH3 domain-containing protein [bacterium]|nr:SH3 domain-containing protein [bacterium]
MSRWLRLIVLLFLFGCATSHNQKDFVSEGPKQAVPGSEDSSSIVGDDQSQILSDADSATKESCHELEEENAGLQLQLLEKEALIQDLSERIVKTQQELTNAVNEVVRVKSRLKSLDSRAEAASSLAETEIAIRTSKKASLESTEDIQTVENLLEAANEEFKKENYSGSLYLTNRIQSLLQPTQGPTLDISFNQSEERFRVPLKLKTTTRSNIREGPGLEFKVISTLEAGVSVLGISVQNRWVRIQMENGEIGWIYYRLAMNK